MNFNIANMVYWMARMTVKNGITGMTRMTQDDWDDQNDWYELDGQDDCDEWDYCGDKDD